MLLKSLKDCVPWPRVLGVRCSKDTGSAQVEGEVSPPGLPQVGYLSLGHSAVTSEGLPAAAPISLWISALAEPFTTH